MTTCGCSAECSAVHPGCVAASRSPYRAPIIELRWARSIGSITIDKNTTFIFLVLFWNKIVSLN